MPIQAGRTWFGKLSFQCYFRRMETAPSIDPTAWTQDLLASLGRANASNQHSLQIIGHDPVIATTFRAGEAAAAVLAANATAAADLWCARGGRPQRIEVDVRAAAASLVSFLYLRYQGATLDRRGQATTALYQARDGRWVHLHGGFSSREGTLALLNCDDDAAAIAKAVASWDAQALEDALAERRVCGAKLRSADEWRVHPQGIALAQVPVVEILRLDDADREPPPGPRTDARGARPLSGVRALDLTRVIAGPTCARTLAEHDADVLKITRPDLPHSGELDLETGIGKLSAHLDLRDPTQAETLRKLICTADVFSQSYRPGALATRGFSPEAVAALRPGIVCVTLSAWSHVGPWSNRRGYDTIVQTSTGMAHASGVDGKPQHLPVSAIDYVSGNLMAFGAMVALARRATIGGSWLVRVSLATTGRWIVDRGTFAAEQFSGLAADLPEDEVEPLCTEVDAPDGRIRYLAPIVRM